MWPATIITTRYGGVYEAARWLAFPLEWSEIPALSVLDMMETSRPVCWNCMIAEGFRRDHPDLVVERPPRPGKRVGAMPSGRAPAQVP